MLIDSLIDEVVSYFSRGEYKDEVGIARKEFTAQAGSVAEGSDRFEEQLNVFLDWYIFERPLRNHGVEPIVAYVNENLGDKDAFEREVFFNFLNSTFSIFEVIAIKRRDVYLKDLFSKEKYIVEDCELYKSFMKKDIFQGRLIPFKDKLVFSNSFVFHPAEVRKYIVKEIKLNAKLDKNFKKAFVFKLNYMKLKSEQYPHVSVDHVYSREPLL